MTLPREYNLVTDTVNRSQMQRMRRVRFRASPGNQLRDNRRCGFSG